MSHLLLVAGLVILALLWRSRPRPLPRPEDTIYRDRFGIEFGQMSREQVEAVMRRSTP